MKKQSVKAPTVKKAKKLTGDEKTFLVCLAVVAVIFTLAMGILAVVSAVNHPDASKKDSPDSVSESLSESEAKKITVFKDAAGILEFMVTGENEVAVYDYFGDYSSPIAVPSSVTNEGKNYTVTSLSENAFLFVTDVSVTLPKSITAIGDSCFGYVGVSPVITVYYEGTTAEWSAVVMDTETQDWLDTALIYCLGDAEE